MQENEIERLKRLRLPKLVGTWEEIVKIIRNFSNVPNFPINTDGFLIKFIGVKRHYTPYVFTEAERNILLLRKRSKYFMSTGAGQIDIPDENNFIFRLVEIPDDIFALDNKKLRNSYNLKIADKQQHEYY